MALRLCHVTLANGQLTPTETLLAMLRIALHHLRMIAFFALIGLSACTTPSWQAVGILDTTIKGDDIRLFRYTLPLFREKSKPRGGGQNRNNDRKDNEETQLKRADYLLSQHPKLNEYCPHGYTVSEKYAVLNEIIIRGECKYKAQ
jgi:hypothetical protein